MEKREREREKERKEGKGKETDPVTLCHPFGSHARCEFRQNYKPRIGEGRGHSLREGFVEL